jgi:Quinolinate synthase
VAHALENGINQINVDEQTRTKAVMALEKMLELAQ